MMPYRLTRPQVGLTPVSPLQAEGKRIEPPVSEPRLPKQSPQRWRPPEPEDDTPVQRSSHHGLVGRGISG